MTLASQTVGLWLIPGASLVTQVVENVLGRQTLNAQIATLENISSLRIFPVSTVTWTATLLMGLNASSATLLASPVLVEHQLIVLLARPQNFSSLRIARVSVAT